MAIDVPTLDGFNPLPTGTEVQLKDHDGQAPLAGDSAAPGQAPSAGSFPVAGGMRC